MVDRLTIGIDLGTRYALTAFVDDGGTASIIPNRWGSRRTPSVVAWSRTGWIAGEEAERMEFLMPRNTWWNVKRKVGTDWRASAGFRRVSAEEVLVPLITILREDAEAHLGSIVSSCVLTVPANFSFLERAAIARSATEAGFSETRIINEPTAAALASGGQGRFLVLDFGGGTVDASVVEYEDGVWQVLESRGLRNMGGRDLDVRLALRLADELGLGSPDRDSSEWRMLLFEAERIKCALSLHKTFSWHVPPALTGGLCSPLTVRRDETEALFEESLREVVDMVRRLWNVHLPESLLLVGGSSRIPLLRSMIEEEVAHPSHLCQCPDESVVLGAAIYGTMKRQRLMIDVLSEDLGIVSFDGTPVSLMKKGMPLPARISKSFRGVGCGAVRLHVFQGCAGTLEKISVIADIDLRNLESGENVEISFTVDTGGLLHIEVLRNGGRLMRVLPLEMGRQERNSRLEGNKEAKLNDLEKRLARVSLAMNSSQQDRLQKLIRRVRILENADVDLYRKMLGTLEKMTVELEEVSRP